MISIYLAVALLSYGLGAGDMDLVAGMPRGPALRITAGLLALHVVVVYVLKSLVLARYLHRRWRPDDVDRRTVASYLRHGGCGVAMLTFGYLVANAVPFFSQLLGIIGGLLAGPINFIGPICLYLVALGRDLHLREASGGVEKQDSNSQDAVSMPPPPSQFGCEGSPERAVEDRMLLSAAEADAPRLRRLSAQSSNISPTSTDAGGGFSLLFVALRSLPLWEITLIVATVIFVLLTMVLGVAEEVNQVLDLQTTLGAPFDCHLLPGS